jgi:hypothetical protein
MRAFLETADGEAITKSNIHVHRIKVFIFLALKGTPTVGLMYRGIRVQGQRKLPTIHPFAVTANLKDVFVIPKLPTAHSPMELFQCPVGLLIWSVSSTARMNRRKIGPLTMEQLDDRFTRESGE